MSSIGIWIWSPWQQWLIWSPSPARTGRWCGSACGPLRRSRSSLFHLRLERKHPGGYDHHSRARYEALAKEGREVTEDLAAGSAEPRGALARWRKERPAGYSDGRKLLAAVLLLADPPA